MTTVITTVPAVSATALRCLESVPGSRRTIVVGDAAKLTDFPKVKVPCASDASALNTAVPPTCNFPDSGSEKTETCATGPAFGITNGITIESPRHEIIPKETRALEQTTNESFIRGRFDRACRLPYTSDVVGGRSSPSHSEGDNGGAAVRRKPLGNCACCCKLNGWESAHGCCGGIRTGSGAERPHRLRDA